MPAPVPPRLVAALGLSQFICWGIGYYMIGVFGAAMATDLGWPVTWVFGGFSAALVVMGLTSGLIGRLVDRHGGRPVMSAGSLLLASAFGGLALAQGPLLFALSWAVLGLAMRMTLYESAFAAMARLAGPEARRPISQITLPGGLASTAFWPIGHFLVEQLGWRPALWCYAALALATLPLHLSIPAGRYEHPAGSATPETQPLTSGREERKLAALLFVTLFTLAAFVNSGISAHPVGLLTSLGLGAAAAVWLSSLRGIGQSAARLCEIVFGRYLSPLALGVGTAALWPLAFVAGLIGGDTMAGGVVFALAYGAANGLFTIVKGAQPLVLFDPRDYAVLTGRFAAPGFFMAALGPLAYAAILEHAGATAALYLSLLLAAVILGCALALWWRFRLRA